MLDHVSLPVSDLDRSKRFYEAALGKGYRVCEEATRLLNELEIERLRKLWLGLFGG